jgi:hypothetical protein
MKPTEISSIFLISNIFFTIYNDNYIFLLTEIPMILTSILYHHNLVSNMRITDIVVVQHAFWHHMYIAYYHSNFVICLYILCPILYTISQIFHYKNEIYISEVFHACIHYTLSLATLFLNLILYDFYN